MSTYRIDLKYYGEVQESHEFDDVEQARYKYYDLYDWAFGGVELYKDGELIEGATKVKEILGTRPRRAFYIPPREQHDL